MEIRPTKPSDYKDTENLMREAFWNLYAPGCHEHYLLHVMRNSPGFVRELDLVAANDGTIIGNIAYMKSVIQSDVGSACEVLSLGPIAVRPAYQRTGVGKALIEYSRCLAREMGFKLILSCGDPDYYRRREFVPAETLGIRTAEDMYFAALQVCALHKNEPSAIQGRYLENGAYNVNEADVAAFDKNFPHWEKIKGTPGQQRFRQIATMIRPATSYLQSAP